MRRVIIPALCTAIVLVVGYGFFVVAAVTTAVMGAVGQAVAEIGGAIATLALILTTPFLVALAWVLLTADWFTFFELIRRLLGVLGMI